MNKREVFIDLSKLPTSEKTGSTIRWSKTIGMEVDFVYKGIKGRLKILDYNSKKRQITIKYGNKMKVISSSNFSKGAIGDLVGFYEKDYRFEESQLIVDENRELEIIGRFKENGYKIYKYKCLICGWKKGEIRETHLLNGIGCSCCHGNVVVEGINDIPTTEPQLIKFFQGGIKEAKKYTKSSSKKIFPICPYCGDIKKKSIKINSLNRRKTMGCICSDSTSYPEKFINSFLQQMSLDYVYQYSKRNSTWIESGIRYDFYIPSLNAIIEVHGEQHYYESSFTTSLEEQQRKDKLKEELAILNGINNYIIIDCRESNVDWIKESILKSELFHILDLDKMDIKWKQCDENAHGNLIKNVCLYYNEHPNIKLKDIAKVFKIHHSTVTKYLKKGNKFNWCNYKR